MDNFFDDLNKLFKNIGNSIEGMLGSEKKERYTDPDMQEAMEELDDYLNDEDTKESKSRAKYKEYNSNTNQSRKNQYKPRQNKELNELKQDYANLEVSFLAPFKKVKEAYKKLLRKYHPDKHINNPEKLKIATEITKKINSSYSRIKAYNKKK